MRRIIILSLFLGTNSLCAAPSLSITYTERPPYTITESNIATGILNELARNILDDSKLSYTFFSRPSKRLMLEIKDGTNTCGVGWFKTPEREVFAQFSLPFYTNEPLKILISKKRSAEFERYKTLNDIFSVKKLRLGINESWSYGDYVDHLMAEQNPTVYKTAQGSDELVKRLARNEIDYMFVVPEEINEQINTAHLPLREFISLPLSDIKTGNKRYFMCSKDIDPKIMSKINQSIQKVIK